MQPPYIIVRVSQASMSPPTGSTAPAHIDFSSGRVPMSSEPRVRTFVAPSMRK